MTITDNRPVDVNAAFITERRGQIAAAERAFEAAKVADAQRVAAFDQRIADGKLKPLGGSRFEVTDPGSYDNGEVLYLTRRQSDGATLILPEHGLEEVDGKISLYSSTPFWHDLGTIIPGGVTDVGTVLRLSGQDWPVHTVPAQYLWNGVLRTHKDMFHTVRGDNGNALGIVGRVYEKGGVIQNADAYAFILDLVGQQDLLWESAGVMRGGSRIFICARLPEDLRVDVEGIDDRIVPIIALLNSHDGSGKLKLVMTPWRIGCRNTEHFAVRDAWSTWEVRHTGSHNAQMAVGRKSLALTHRYYEHWLEEENALVQTPVAANDFDKMIDELWPVDEDLAAAIAGGADLTRGQKSAVSRRTKRRDQLVNLFDKNTGELGRNAYAAERAVTEYLDHFGQVKVPKTMTESMARGTRVLEGADNDRKSAVHRQLLTLVKR